MELIAVDIGGTHARFAIASVDGGRVVSLADPVTLRTADHPSFASAWRAFASRHADGLPRAAALAIAAPVAAEVISMVNNPWTIARATLSEEIDVDRLLILNDFGAVAHAVAQLPAEWLAHVTGPDVPLPEEGTISILGPGTGLGIAHLWRDGGGGYHVQSAEGGHMSFGPIDAIDDALLARLRERHGRVSVERVVSGPAIVDIHAVLAAQAGEPVPLRDDKRLWELGLSGDDELAAAAIRHFCRQLGAVAGDVALAQGGTAVVVAGGLGLRLRDILPRSGFGSHFRAKGRFAEIMAAMPVKLITHPQPGLFGAAAAFAREHMQ
jgi:glucokinase